MAKIQVHFKVFSVGRCASCNAYNEVMIYDYGRMTYAEMEKKMDTVKHEVKNLQCKKCGHWYPPKSMVYRDSENKIPELSQEIPYGSLRTQEESAEWMAAHEARYEVFESKASEFWMAYTDFALEDWRAAVNELTRVEIESAYKEMGIKSQLRTDQHARKDALNRNLSDADKRIFWRAANEYFVREELLYIGAVGWTPVEYAKTYGRRRTQFAMLHFPVPDVHEPERTRSVAQLFRRDRGDNAFLLRKLSTLNNEVEGAKKRATEYFHANETLKAEVAVGQRKLAEAYDRIRQLEDALQASALINTGDSNDKRKIREQKSFISELLTEVKRLQKLLPEASATVDFPDTGPSEPEDTENDPPQSYASLQGKTLVIIGGDRSEQASNVNAPCRIITVDGMTMGVELDAALKQADIIVVLKWHISHAAMWTARAHAIETDTPIIYSSPINIARILDLAAKKLLPS
ncbi:DUF2325 domain-containing protein [Paenibacillus campinasensis]|nr:DUF2325 domain-containing protein [Paenibacillus campinasensis]